MKFNKLGAALTLSAATAFASVPAFAQSMVEDAASAFTSQWAGDAAVIGGALIGAAFLAIGFKWVKGMIFN